MKEINQASSDSCGEFPQFGNLGGISASLVTVFPVNVVKLDRFWQWEWVRRAALSQADGQLTCLLVIFLQDMLLTQQLLKLSFIVSVREFVMKPSAAWSSHRPCR